MSYKDDHSSYTFTIPSYKIYIENPYIELERKKILHSFLYEYINIIKQYMTIHKKEIEIQKQVLLFLAYLHNKNTEDPVLLSGVGEEILKNIFMFMKKDKSNKDTSMSMSISNKNTSISNKDMSISKKDFEEIDKKLQIECDKALEKMRNIHYPKKFTIKKEETQKDIFLSMDNIKHKVPKKLYYKVKKQHLDPNKDFDTLLFCLIIRYKAIYNYNTMSLGVPINVYDVLYKKYNVSLELFGSAFNNHMPNYGGLFYDLEKDFGCRGNVMNIELEKGFYVCNPPYEIYLIKLTYEKLLRKLDTTKELTIFNVLPAWNEMFSKDIKKHCKQELKHFDIYNIYNTIFSSKYLLYHRLYCKDQFPFYHYLEDKIFPATHCHIFILSNTEVDFSHIDKVLDKYTHCLSYKK